MAARAFVVCDTVLLPHCVSSHDEAPEGGVDAGIDAPVVRDAAVEASVCPMGFWPARPMFDRSCAADADCVLALYWSSCCTAHVGGMAASAFGTFTTVNDACNAHAFHDCGCAMTAEADDGSSAFAYAGLSAFTVRCDAHVCVSGLASCSPATCVAGGGSCAPVCTSAGLAAECLASPLPTCDGGTACACLTAADAAVCGTGSCVDATDGGYACACP